MSSAELLFVAVLLGLAVGCTDGELRRPNVLVLSLDTLNRNAQRAYDPDADPLPGFDQLARESLVFERCYSTAPWTLPAQASLLTGLYPDRHGATQPRLRLSPDVQPLAEHLSQAGYETVGFSDGGFVDARFGLATGFGRYNETVEDAELASLDLPRDGHFSQVAGESLFDRTIEYLEERQDDEPFFAFVQTFSVHEYYRARPWATAGMDPRRLRKEKYYLQCLKGQREGTPGDWRTLRALYQAEMHHLDAGLARLLDAIDRLGLRESTVLIVVSDHGEGLDPERGRISHGGRLHADLIRVPLLVRGPGIRPGRTDEPVSLVDVAPTVLDLAGLGEPPELDGESLIDVLYGGAELPERTLYAQCHAFAWNDGARVQLDGIRSEPASLAVITEGMWYIRSESTGEELYREDEDPDQLEDLVGRSDELDELRRLAADRVVPRVQATLLRDDGETQARLSELGYGGE